jgi:hypothetical protein
MTVPKRQHGNETPCWTPRNPTTYAPPPQERLAAVLVAVPVLLVAPGRAVNLNTRRVGRPAEAIVAAEIAAARGHGRRYGSVRVIFGGGGGGAATHSLDEADADAVAAMHIENPVGPQRGIVA